MWGSGADDVWAVGVGGTVIHFDGDDWRSVAVTPTPVVPFVAVVGSGPNDVWAVGDFGIIVHYDGEVPVVEHRR